MTRIERPVVTLCLLVMLITVCFSSVAIGRSQTPPSAQQSGGWPPPGIDVPGQDGVTAPKVINQVKPRYTAEAMRAQIAGSVFVGCIVEADGTVSAARVIRSLDAIHGLDDEATKAAQQWRFEPAMKGGVPVRVAITIQLSFALGAPPSSSRSDAAAGALPKAFAAASQPNPHQSAGTTTADGTVDVRIGYGDGWDWRKTETSQAAQLTLANVDGRRTLSVTSTRLAKPLPALLAPASPEQLQRALDIVRAQTEKGLPAMPGAHVEFADGGQASVANRVWVWVELSLTDVQNAVAAANALGGGHLQSDRGRMWMFTTYTGNYQVVIACLLLHQSGMSVDEIQTDVQRAGAEFAGMLAHLTVDVR